MGICLTDTFQMYETKDMLNELLPVNSARRKRQVALPIRVIMGNPPYSSGQKSANDNAQNVAYPLLDKRIGETYVEHSTANIAKGISMTVTSGRFAGAQTGWEKPESWRMSPTPAGLMVTPWMDCASALVDEFYEPVCVFIYEGTSGRTSLSSGSAKEGGNVFGIWQHDCPDSHCTLLVKNPKLLKTHGKIYYP